MYICNEDVRRLQCPTGYVILIQSAEGIVTDGSCDRRFLSASFFFKALNSVFCSLKVKFCLLHNKIIESVGVKIA